MLRLARFNLTKFENIDEWKNNFFQGIPSPLEATRYHSLIVDDKNLPKCLKVTAKVGDGTIMGLEHCYKKIFGVQFHPESIASQYGYQIIQNFLSLTEDPK